MLRIRTAVALSTALLVLSAAPASAQSQVDITIERTVELTNVERQRNGLAPLTLSVELRQAAQAYSVILATSGCFAHDCGPVPDMAERLEQAGYTGWTAIAENIAAGYTTPESVIRGWMNSPGHRANLLSPHYTEIGIGIATGGGRFGIFWTQNFGTRQIASMPVPELDVEPEPATEIEAESELEAVEEP